jgi:methenyltetrahydromethanopterin cyclohydrolase
VRLENLTISYSRKVVTIDLLHLLFGSTVCVVEHNNEAAGKPFLQIFREADRDFHKDISQSFRPAVLMINNAKTGKVFKAGEINHKVPAGSLRFYFFLLFLFLFLQFETFVDG